MTDRVVKISLTAQVSNYVSAFEQAQNATTKFSDDAVKHLDQQRAAMERVGTASLAFGAIAAAGVAIAVNKFAEFDQAMSAVQAATHESAANMGLLRDAAIEAGSSTVFTATESANAIEELSKAGLSTADILGGALKGALDLASAGSLDVADAAQIAATALTQFKLKGGDVPHVADLLAAGAGKAQGSVQDLSAALNQSGLVASQTGLSIEETTGTLAAFASAGLIGSDSGTSFKTMLQRLTPQSAEAKAKMDELGISAYDAGGNFIGMAKFAGVLSSALKDKTAEERNSALATIFGSDSVRAAAVLYDQGAKGIQSWIDRTNDAGYAAETARIKLDNLNGDVEKLGGAFDTFLIKSGSAANGTLRFLTQGLTEVVDLFGSAPPFVQQTALALAAVAAAAALAAAAFLIGVPQIAAFNAALVTLSVSTMPGVAAGATSMMVATTRATAALSASAKFLTGPWGLALAAAAVGVVALQSYLDSLKASSEEMTNSLTTATTAKQIFEKGAQGEDLGHFQSTVDTLKDLNGVLDIAGKRWNDYFSTMGSPDAMSQQAAAESAIGNIGKSLGDLAKTDLPGAQRAFSLLADETDGSEKQLWRLISLMPEYKDALTKQATSLGVNVTSTDEVANKQALLAIATGKGTAGAVDQTEQLEHLAGQSDDTGEAISKLADQISNFGKAQFDANDAQRAFEQAIDDASDALQRQKDDFLQPQKDAYEAANGSLDGFVGSMDGFTASLDVNTQNGRDNQAALDAIAQGANTSAAAILTQTGSVDLSTAALGRGRDALIAQLAQFGITGAEADAYVAKLLATPESIETQAKLTGIQEATAAYEAWFNSLNGRILSAVVRTTAEDTNGSASGNGQMGTMATGGAVHGPGGPTDDVVPIWASNGEHMLDASDVEAMGGQSGVYAFRAALHNRGSMVAAGNLVPASGGGSYAGSGGSTSVSVSPSVSLAGATLVMSVDGRQMTAVIQEQIVKADSASSDRVRAAKRVDF